MFLLRRLIWMVLVSMASRVNDGLRGGTAPAKATSMRRAIDSFQSVLTGGLICGAYGRIPRRVAPVAPVPCRGRRASLRPGGPAPAHDPAALDAGHRQHRAAVGRAPV